MWTTPIEEVEKKLTEWNNAAAIDFSKQMKEQKSMELKRKIEKEKEKPLIALKSFLIKLEDDNKIKRIEDIQTITDKIDYIESLLFKEIVLFFVQKNDISYIEDFNNLDNRDDKISYFNNYLKSKKILNPNEQIRNLQYVLKLLDDIKYNNSI